MSLLQILTAYIAVSLTTGAIYATSMALYRRGQQRQSLRQTATERLDRVLIINNHNGSNSL